MCYYVRERSRERSRDRSHTQIPQVVFHMIDKNKITIYEVASKAGVSRQTVSRVLNNRMDVSEETRKRVQEVITELNYRPSAIAQSLSRQKSFLLGVVTAGLKYTGPSRTLSGITSKAEELGYGLLLKELPRFTTNNVHTLIQWFQAHQVDGIIWAAPEIGDNRNWLDSLIPSINIPIFFLTMQKYENVSIVVVDNFEGARLATKHLIDSGRRNIGHVSGPMDWWEARERKSGWASVLQEAGIAPQEKMVVEGNWSSKSGKQAFLELVSKYPEMDAVFVGNDQMALSVLQTALEMGKKIPDNLLVVGFDGIADSEFYSPSLTTVCQNQDELGSIAVDELVRLVEAKYTSNNVSSPKYIKIQPELVIRQSSQKR
ncbi:MAG TPA: LacI family DNA-binding transcriptional regulator [Anaerolineaceae bacterium]|nr:LacI family DNA-binding transcriptional regulator [Anaerolineaceae bacterium]